MQLKQKEVESPNTLQFLPVWRSLKEQLCSRTYREMNTKKTILNILSSIQKQTFEDVNVSSTVGFTVDLYIFS